MTSIDHTQDKSALIDEFNRIIYHAGDEHERQSNKLEILKQAT